MTATPTRPRDPHWFKTYWPLYLVGGILAFAVPETLSIVVFRGDGGTLSEWSRDQLGMGDDGRLTIAWGVLTTILAGFAVWFPLHLARKWPWEKQPQP